MWFAGSQPHGKAGHERAGMELRQQLSNEHRACARNKLLQLVRPWLVCFTSLPIKGSGGRRESRSKLAASAQLEAPCGSFSGESVSLASHVHPLTCVFPSCSCRVLRNVGFGARSMIGTSPPAPWLDFGRSVRKGTEETEPSEYLSQSICLRAMGTASGREAPFREEMGELSLQHV